MRNIEMKAKITDFNEFVTKVKLLSESDGTIIPQHDTFYKTQQGRLKLRKFESGDAVLIYYERPDSEGPKLSSYEKSDIVAANVDNVHKVLSRALGVTGVVRKQRHLFMVDQTRIHVDSVEGLGNFMELEVVLKPEQTIEDGEAVVQGLMDKLGIQKQNLLAGAYTDMLP